MARIIVGSWMVRYPLGAAMSWVLQYLTGLQRLGHEVFFVEKALYWGECFDPEQQIMTNDASYGLNVVRNVLASIDMQKRICFVDYDGNYHGLGKNEIEDIFRSADLFIDMGTHGAWLQEAEKTCIKIFIDGDPGFVQMKMEMKKREGKFLREYDFYFSNGKNIGTPECTIPTAGIEWLTLYHPVDTALYQPQPLPADGMFTSIMNWQSFDMVEFEGKQYGNKDIEFPKFMELPRFTKARLELAVAGKNVPEDQLSGYGWHLRNPHQVTISLDSFIDYVIASAGEFSVCKHCYVTTYSGWFSDRSAVYLALGRPVVMQETGFSRHLPCGNGLFAVNDIEEAVSAFDNILSNPRHHSKCAREIAEEYLETTRILQSSLNKIGL
ncbi:MAG: hypothetical protein HGB36_10980 [Chlorobiaceae bacterium]|nr:hypothetical protein [Chlorobiaceae bacterium]